MNTIERSPTLQSTTRTGKKKYWYGEVFEENGDFFIKKVWWQDGGKVQESTPTQIKGKNIGKSNETTDEEQAIFDLGSIVQKQRDKGYSEDGSDGHIPTKPMLAHNYNKRSHNIKWPAFVQPKLDGFRMIFDGNRGWTRGSKEHVPECIAHLQFDGEGFEFDGELILPGNVPLQETASAAKKYREGISEQLIFVVYDLVRPDWRYDERWNVLTQLAGRGIFPDNVRLIDCHEVQSEEEMFSHHVRFTKNGYEGTIIRNFHGKYDVGNRSPNLQKYKEFQDGEFRIVSVEEGVGSFVGKAVFVCQTENGNTFNVVPEGTMDYRAMLYETRDQHVNRFLTVRYQTLTNDGIPQFPVGVDFREPGEF